MDDLQGEDTEIQSTEGRNERRKCMRRLGILIAVALFASGSLFGCSTDRMVRQANDSFEKARQAGAETKAPYEFYAAQEYLELAEHEKDEMDNKQARIWAEQSLKHSAAALDKAGGGGK
jgi:hypothetical protein